MDAGRRLKEERERLGLTQIDLAALCGVGRLAQGNYESGARHPDAVYLSRAATAGVDVLYVLTGRREPSQAPDEQALIAGYRAASPELRAAALRLLGAQAVGAGAGRTISGGEQGQVVMGDQHVQGPMSFSVGGSRKRKG
ncbi:MAG: transcriptional regulator [Silanimonas sp.]|jgi:transcriptional regulator with XRE-family HTH domain|nr:MAG: transcriptional regulator [Silanimonas sp.]